MLDSKFLTDEECWKRVAEAQQCLFKPGVGLPLADVQKLIGFLCFAAFHKSGLTYSEVVEPLADKLEKVWPLMEGTDSLVSLQKLIH